MSIPRALVFAAVCTAPAICCTAQSTAAGTTGATGSSANYFTPTAPSDILQRSLDEVKITVGNVRIDKWKRGSVRDEASNNIDAIQRDLQGTLPGLLRDADSAPGSRGTSTRGICSERAMEQACRGPAPPKLTSVNSRGS